MKQQRADNDDNESDRDGHIDSLSREAAQNQ
jgi:hypothetical protein